MATAMTSDRLAALLGTRSPNLCATVAALANPGHYGAVRHGGHHRAPRLERRRQRRVRSC